MKAQANEWEGNTRPCDYSICLPDHVVFMDFCEDEEARLFLERMSFDGYGCYALGSKSGVTKIAQADSRKLKAAIVKDDLEGPEVEEILLGYLRENTEVIGEEALQHHKLI